jgi:2-(1,2-epoxy-1,2-dihydrophenyl)acetyl-CoA isomerase
VSSPRPGTRSSATPPGDLVRERVRLVVRGSVASVTLASPATGNALDLAMAEGLQDVATDIAGRPGLRAVQLDAEGRTFCVGGDLREFGAVADPASHVERVAAAAHGAITLLRGLSAPVVCVVQGAAGGGGLGLALVGDVVLAARQARFRVAYTAAGLSPDCGVSFHLGRVLGPALALDLALTNRSLTAEEAERCGLVSRVVDDGDLVVLASSVVRQLADGPAHALAATKRLLRAAADRSWDDQLAAEAASIAKLAGSAEGREGIAAFLERRAPTFGG